MSQPTQMLILFDHGTPDGLVRALQDHIITLAREMGWERLTNGDLLTAAEAAGFDLLLTTDRRIRYQQTSPEEKSQSWCCPGPPNGRAFDWKLFV